MDLTMTIVPEMVRDSSLPAEKRLPRFLFGYIGGGPDHGGCQLGGGASSI